LLNVHDQELTLDDLVEIRKPSALEEAEDSVPEPKERTMMASKLTDGLELVKAGIRISEDIDSKELQKTTTQGLTRTLACYEEILKKRSVFRQTSLLYLFKSSSGTRASLPVLLDIGNDDPDGPPPVHEEVPPP
jgi:hypothetical protein